MTICKCQGKSTVVSGKWKVERKSKYKRLKYGSKLVSWSVGKEKQFAAGSGQFAVKD